MSGSRSGTKDDPQPFAGAFSNPGFGLNSQPLGRAASVASQPVVTVSCFRCQAQNPSDRLFCTSCGYELADRKAAADRVMGPNGRPILARFLVQNGQMGGRSFRFHQGLTKLRRTRGSDLVIQ